jgi:predicted ATP-binding protein involved in virulence
MRITEIAVKKLFGIYDHTIPLNLDDRVTIIHGPNGTGKTTILRLVNDVLSGDFSVLRAKPFAELRLVFEDRSTLRIKKSLPKEAGITVNDTQVIIFEYEDVPNQRTEKHFLSIAKLDMNQVQAYSPDLAKQLSDRQGKVHKVPPEYTIPDQEIQIPPPWFQKIRESIHSYLIETQRLHKMQRDQEQALGGTPRLVSMAEAYTLDLADNIKGKLAKSATLSQDLDRTFPTRLLKQSGKNVHATETSMRERLARLEQKRTQLIGAGLLDPPGEQEDVFDTDTTIDAETLAVLAIYLDDTEKKLAVFDDLYSKINALLTIINKRFLNKKMKIDKARGFIFESVDGTHIESTDLSSGEQHELVLFYELLFRVPAGSLILIDEPEISLHVAWQIEFLHDLLEVARLADLDIVLATHSPQIINDRWDLTVELKGTPGERVPNAR